MELPEGFVKHDGGPMPVAPECMVEIIMRSQERPDRIYHREGDDQAAWFDALDWWTGSSRWKIIAYRPTEGQQP